ncbi:MAG: peroxiredoxin, partial [Pseudomonadales bacterium]|nr:peroxiredoxin [Pseudomonadales bacterium]
MNKVALDQPVPEFEAPATSNKNIRFSALTGYNVVIFFY